MNYFAGGIFTDSEFAGLIFYLLVCGSAIILIAVFTIKIAYLLLKHRTYTKKYLAYIGGGIALLILSNLIIEL